MSYKVSSANRVVIVFFLAVVYLFFCGLMGKIELALSVFFSKQYVNQLVHYSSNFSEKKPVVVYEGVTIKNTGFKIDGYFSVNKLGRYQDIFQTDNVNAGVRAEISPGGHFAVLYQTALGLRALTFNNTLVAGEKYHFVISAINGVYVHAKLNNQLVQSTAIPNFQVKSVLVGSGFSSDRILSGNLNAIKVILYQRNLIVADSMTIFVRIMLFILFLVTLFSRDFEVKLHQLTHFEYQKNSYDPLLLMRALAFFMVFLGHNFMVLFFSPELHRLIFSGYPVWLLTSSPWSGVWIFFVLSGYLMGKGFLRGRYTLSRGGVFNFYKNRLLRIYPTYFFVVLLTSALIHPEIFQPKYLYILMSLLTFHYNGFAPVNSNGALWTISTEMQFYLIAPFLIAGIDTIINMKSYRFIILFVAIAIVFSVFRHFLFLENKTLGYFFLNYYTPLICNLDLFIFGILANFGLEILFKYKIARPKIILMALGMLTFLYVICSLISSKAMLQNIDCFVRVFITFLPTIVGVITSIVIMLFELARSTIPPKKYIIANYLFKRAEIFGILTFCLYVWSEPVMLSIRKIYPQSISLRDSISAFFTIFILVMIIALITYHYIEKHFDKMRSVALWKKS